MVCSTNGLHTTLYRRIHIADLRLLFDSVLAATLTSPEPVEFCPAPYVHPRTAAARNVSERTAACTTSNELLLLTFPTTTTITTTTTKPVGPVLLSNCFFCPRIGHNYL